MRDQGRRWARMAGVFVLATWGATGAQAQASCDLCRTGQNQSPVRLERIVVAPNASGPRLQGAAESVQVVDNGGKNLMVLLPQATRNTLVLDADGPLALVEFHFHAPGEHAEGQAAPGPLEAHFVHARADGTRAVLGVPIAVGAQTHPLLSRLLGTLDSPGLPQTLPNFDPTALRFHAGRHLLRYAGSLTTGQCDEGIGWFMYETGSRPALTISATDLGRYTGRFPPYARDLQPLHARVVLRVGAPTLVRAR